MASLALAAWLALWVHAQTAAPVPGVAPCWSALPSKQAAKLKTILRSWPPAVHAAALDANGEFPCNLVRAISAADKGILRHVQANPLPVNYDIDWGNPRSWPGYQVDRYYRTVLVVSKETVAPPQGPTRRRDCIGIQDAAFTAIVSADPKLDGGILPERLVIGNNPILGHAYAAAQFLTGGNPVDGGVHHVVGVWPVLKIGGKVRGADGEVPEWAVILDYWITQDPADPMDLMTPAQFSGLFSGLDETGPLRTEE